MASARTLPPIGPTVGVGLFAIAMAYLEAAVVVYLRVALGDAPGEVFPLDVSGDGTALGWIELGREAATMVMIAAVGWVVGRSGLERLAWAAVVFGLWDIGYYGWLWVFSGWPPSLGTWDLLFLIPAPWAGPVWAPIVVSLALVGFGLAMAGRCRSAGPPHATPAALAALVIGGVVVIGSFVANAGVVLGGGTPSEFPWIVFWAGIAVGASGAVAILRGPGAVPPGADA